MATHSEFPETSEPIDPYRTFRFRVKWDGKYVAGISKISGLIRTTDVIPSRPEGQPGIQKPIPGQTTYQPITLERGVTHDVAFEQWANKVWDYHDATLKKQRDDQGNKDMSLKDFRKDIIIEVYNEADQKVLAYNVYRCWPSEYIALPELDSTGNSILIQSLKLENEGWERDESVEDPT